MSAFIVFLLLFVVFICLFVIILDFFECASGFFSVFSFAVKCFVSVEAVWTAKIVSGLSFTAKILFVFQLVKN